MPACTSPVELTDATPDADEDQVTKEVMFTIKPLGHEPVAVSCCCCPIATEGLVGITAMEVIPASDPVPERATVCGLVLALSVTVRVPVRLPRAVGVKVTEIVQLAPPANVFGVRGQVDVCAKSPETETVEIVSALVCAFFRVTVFAVLVVVGTWLPKVRPLGDNVTGRIPVPLKEEVCGEFEALSLTVKVPVRLPETVGVKVMEMVHFAPAPSVLGDRGQVEVCAKSPEAEILVIVSGTV